MTGVEKMCNLSLSIMFQQQCYRYKIQYRFYFELTVQSKLKKRGEKKP